MRWSRVKPASRHRRAPAHARARLGASRKAAAVRSSLSRSFAHTWSRRQPRRRSLKGNTRPPVVLLAIQTRGSRTQGAAVQAEAEGTRVRDIVGPGDGAGLRRPHKPSRTLSLTGQLMSENAVGALAGEFLFKYFLK